MTRDLSAMSKTHAYPMNLNREQAFAKAEVKFCIDFNKRVFSLEWKACWSNQCKSDEFRSNCKSHPADLGRPAASGGGLSVWGALSRKEPEK